jgi:hypothetical protein
MKTTIKSNIDSQTKFSIKNYSSLDEFVASKLKDAKESLKKVDLSALKK